MRIIKYVATLNDIEANFLDLQTGLKIYEIKNYYHRKNCFLITSMKFKVQSLLCLSSIKKLFKIKDKKY